MINHLKSLLIAVLLLLTVSTYSQSVEFRNFDSWNEIVSAAKKENKYIFVEVYTDWCRACKKLEKEVFNMEKVALFYNKNFINVKLNAEDDGFGSKFAKTHNIDGYPTMLYFNHKGDWVHRLAGYRDFSRILNTGWDAINEDNQLVTHESKFKKGESGLEFLEGYIVALDQAGLDYAPAINSYVAQLSDLDLIEEDHWRVVSGFFHDVDSEFFEKMITMKAGLEKVHGTASVNEYLINAYTTKIDEIAENGDVKELNDFTLRLKSRIPDLSDNLAAFTEYEFYKNDEKLAHEYASKYLSNYCSDYRELNSVAWKYFEDVDDEIMLNEALFWAMKSVRLDENWYNTDTYANLLFKLGRLEEAKKVAERSIEIAVRDGEDHAETQILLEKVNNSLEGR